MGLSKASSSVSITAAWAALGVCPKDWVPGLGSREEGKAPSLWVLEQVPGAGKDWWGAGEGGRSVGELPWHAPSPLGSQLRSVGHSQFLEEEGEQRALGLLPVQAAYSGEVPPRLFA